MKYATHIYIVSKYDSEELEYREFDNLDDAKKYYDSLDYSWCDRSDLKGKRTYRITLESIDEEEDIESIDFMILEPSER